jgi:hypothetical protein
MQQDALTLRSGWIQDAFTVCSVIISADSQANTHGDDPGQSSAFLARDIPLILNRQDRRRCVAPQCCRQLQLELSLSRLLAVRPIARRSIKREKSALRCCSPIDSRIESRGRARRFERDVFRFEASLSFFKGATPVSRAIPRISFDHDGLRVSTSAARRCGAGIGR